jgi:hypothetical protein
MDPHSFSELDPNPHSLKKLDPDPVSQIQSKRIRNTAEYIGIDVLIQLFVKKITFFAILIKKS